MENEPIGYKLSIEGDGVSITKSIDDDTCRRILNILFGGGMPIRPVVLEAHLPTTEMREIPSLKSTNASPMSLREFIEDANARSNPEKIVAFASYFLEVLGRDSFSSEEVKACFSKAAEKMPANYNRDFGLAIQKGWISEQHGSKGQYYVTKTGQKMIKSKFLSEVKYGAV